jgi:hypothetical protein
MAVYYGERNTENDVSWSPLYLAINGSLTVLVTARILYETTLQRYVPRLNGIYSVLHRRTSFGTCRSILVTAGRTVVESALISWVGVFMMLLTDYYPDVGVSPLRNVMETFTFCLDARDAHGRNIRRLRRALRRVRSRHFQVGRTTCSRRSFADNLR